MPFAKIIIMLLTLLILVPGLVSADQTTIRFNLGADINTPKSKAGEYFKRLVEQRSDKRVQVKIVHNVAPENSQSLLEAFKIHRFQMAAPDIRTLMDLNPLLQLFDLPFLFKNAAHLHRIIDGKIGTKLLESTQQQNLVALSFWDDGLIQMAANRALPTPLEAKGLRFSIFGSEVARAQFTRCGFLPQKRRSDHLYAALKAGELNGHENTLANFYNQRLYQVQSDITISEHAFSGYLIVASSHFWSHLPGDLKVIVQGAIKDAAEYTRELAREADQQALEEISSTGMTIVHRLTPEERKLWVQSFQKNYPQPFDRADFRLIQQVLKE